MPRSQKLILIFLVLLAGSFLPTYFFSHKPEAVVGEALQKLAEDQSFLGVATIGMLAPESVLTAAGADPSVALPIVFVGQGGMNLPKDQPVSGQGTFTLTSADDSEPVTLDVVAQRDGSAFAKLSNLPVTDEQSSAVIKALDGQWFSMPSRTLADLLTRDAAAAKPSAIDGTRPVATWQSLRDEIASGDIFGVPTQKGNAGTGLAFIRHYDVPVLNEPLIGVVQDMKSLQKGRSLTSAELDDIAAKVRASKVDLEVWVDIRTKQLQQIQLMVADVDPSNPLITKQKFSLVLKFTAWGEPVEVAPPAESRPYADVVTSAARDIVPAAPVEGTAPDAEAAPSDTAPADPQP